MFVCVQQLSHSFETDVKPVTCVSHAQPCLQVLLTPPTQETKLPFLCGWGLGTKILHGVHNHSNECPKVQRLKCLAHLGETGVIPPWPHPLPVPTGLSEPKVSAPRSPPSESRPPAGLAPPPRAKGVTGSAERGRRNNTGICRPLASYPGHARG